MQITAIILVTYAYACPMLDDEAAWKARMTKAAMKMLKPSRLPKAPAATSPGLAAKAEAAIAATVFSDEETDKFAENATPEGQCFGEGRSLAMAPSPQHKPTLHVS